MKPLIGSVLFVVLYSISIFGLTLIIILWRKERSLNKALAILKLLIIHNYRHEYYIDCIYLAFVLTVVFSIVITFTLISVLF